MSTNRALLRAGVLVATAGMTGLLGAGIAAAHVTANVYGEQPAKGGYGAVFLRVPNEEADAGTTKVEVTFKPEYGISSGRAKPVPGWTSEVTKTKLPAPVKNGKGTDVTEVVSKISWTAQPGTKIAAGSSEFQEFEISVGPLPSNVDSVLLPAAQTYENGLVVNWDQPTPAGGEEPEHPAPEVKLSAAEGGHGAPKSGEKAGAEGAEAAASSSGSDDTARWLGGAGLVVGALGLGLGAGATLRARRSTAAKSGGAAE
ncbi:YcnI family protein [Amycolatopsis nigrescens]|uniref:YcnI family copper-binding membrane protein n=1 Tax=Amycolatopsis nigrescens TaxID=381445 RepID=UPI00039B668E|nr:YcnI family protein [Amycolatopsis nigrescens]